MEALGPHRTAEHMKTFGRVAVKAMTAPPKIEVHHARKSRRRLIKKSQGRKLMIYVIATTPMKPENKDDFIKGHKACTAETLKEKGHLL